ncbi:hypothetical protein BH23ACT6_BH23ACT6_20030 [soil metagenome]
MGVTGSIDPRVHVVSVGAQPLATSWSLSWSGLPAYGHPEVVIQHFSGSGSDPLAAQESLITKSAGGSGLPAVGARIKTEVRARRGHASGAYLWAMKRDATLCDALRRCDVVLSRDEETDAALGQLDDLVDEHKVVRSNGAVGADAIKVGAALQSWADLLGAISDGLEPPVDRVALSELVASWAQTASQIADALVPPAVAPVAQTLEMMLAAQYWATGEGGDDVVWRLGRPLLTRGPEWVSGSLPALDRVMRLRREWHELAEADLQQSTVDALAAAESARLRGQERTARCHSLVALSLVTHRARHPQRPTSTLVTQTSTVVGPLQRDATLRALSDDSAPRAGSRLVARGGIRPTPSVVILPGPFGAFHADLVAALPPVATVTVSDLHQSCPELRRRRPIPQDLWLVAALRRGRINLEDGTLDGHPIRRPSLARHVRCLRRLKIELSHHDVAVSDWGDVTTMWASHLSPKGTRLVTRWHSLDLFDPWLHLIDWRGVDQVMITNSALGSLFRDLTRGTGAPPPVAVRPYLPNLAGFDQPKSADAQFTIGMVGWGRLVKDPAFALDLLQRDARRRLILIGPPFEATVDATATQYAEAIATRIARAELRERVHIVGPTDDVAAHLRGVGIILSSSFREGWHLGLIEGVASGAVPVVRDWSMLSGRRGAASVYPREWIVSDLDEADRAITALEDRARWEAAAGQAKADIMRLMDATAAQQDYREYVLGDRGSAARGGHG